MTDTLYRSHEAVSTRVDRAWLRGYEAGKAEKADRLAVVAVALSIFTLWRQGIDHTRGRSHLIPWAILATLLVVALAVAVVLCAIPVVLVALGIRTGYRHHQTTLSTRATSNHGEVITPEVIDPSTDNEWPDF